MSYQVDNLARSLERIALSLQHDAEALEDFAAQLRADPDASYAHTPLHSNVVALLGRVMNNSSWIAGMESALHTASELVRGADA